MWNGMIIKNGVSGFGQTEEEALQDVYVNACKKDIRNDVENKFVERKQELHPWFPMPNMLHISGIGCLVYEDGSIKNTKSNAAIQVEKDPFFIYRALQRLVGLELSYSDIVVSLKNEITKFFKLASDIVVPVDEYPSIIMLESSNGFEPRVVYSMEGGLLIGITNDAVGMKEYGDEKYYIVPITEREEVYGMLAYLAYRIGIILEV